MRRTLCTWARQAELAAAEGLEALLSAVLVLLEALEQLLELQRRAQLEVLAPHRRPMVHSASLRQAEAALWAWLEVLEWAWPGQVPLLAVVLSGRLS